MVEFDVINKSNNFEEADLSALLRIIDRHPYFELARVKFIEIADELKLDGPMLQSLKAERQALNAILNYKKPVTKPRKGIENEGNLIPTFLVNFQLPHNPSHFKDK